MNIAIIGYGKMGREIEKTAIERGHTIALIIDLHNEKDFSTQNLKICDVALEFTSPLSAPQNIIKCFNSGIPVVTGTTGWKDNIDEIIKLCLEKNGALFHSSNYSPGVNILAMVNQYLAGIMDSFPQYDVEMTEIHHTEKLDKPSGTAISLAEQILQKIKRKKIWTLENKENPEELIINSIREGEIKGIHEIVYNSDIDYISIRHSAKSRKGFALGAVMAAEYLHNKKGVFTMKDLFEF